MVYASQILTAGTFSGTVCALVSAVLLVALLLLVY
jgi:tetrahydromethanopterin S-methyltransferase subunit F